MAPDGMAAGLVRKCPEPRCDGSMLAKSPRRRPPAADSGRGQRAMQVRAWVVSLVLAARRGDSQAAAALTGLSRPQASASTTTAAAGRCAEVCPPPVK